MQSLAAKPASSNYFVVVIATDYRDIGGEESNQSHRCVRAEVAAGQSLGPHQSPQVHYSNQV